MTPLERTHNTLTTICGLNSMLIRECWNIFHYVEGEGTPEQVEAFRRAVEAASYGIKIDKDGAAVLVPTRKE
jgi:hypothetical protein